MPSTPKTTTMHTTMSLINLPSLQTRSCTVLLPANNNNIPTTGRMRSTHIPSCNKILPTDLIRIKCLPL